MPLFIDGAGRTRLIEIPKPYPTVFRLMKWKGLTAASVNPSKLPGPKDSLAVEIVFTRTAPYPEDCVIYESKETAFEDPWQKI